MTFVNPRVSFFFVGARNAKTPTHHTQGFFHFAGGDRRNGRGYQ
jgi:hypothetical protein